MRKKNDYITWTQMRRILYYFLNFILWADLGVGLSYCAIITRGLCFSSGVFLTLAWLSFLIKYVEYNTLIFRGELD